MSSYIVNLLTISVWSLNNYNRQLYNGTSSTWLLRENKLDEGTFASAPVRGLHNVMLVNGQKVWSSGSGICSSGHIFVIFGKHSLSFGPKENFGKKIFCLDSHSIEILSLLSCMHENLASEIWLHNEWKNVILEGGIQVLE